MPTVVIKMIVKLYSIYVRSLDLLISEFAIYDGHHCVFSWSFLFVHLDVMIHQCILKASQAVYELIRRLQCPISH